MSAHGILNLNANWYVQGDTNLFNVKEQDKSSDIEQQPPKIIF